MLRYSSQGNMNRGRKRRGKVRHTPAPQVTTPSAHPSVQMHPNFREDSVKYRDGGREGEACEG